jgi:hypothetical protein
MMFGKIVVGVHCWRVYLNTAAISSHKKTDTHFQASIFICFLTLNVKEQWGETDQ